MESIQGEGRSLGMAEVGPVMSLPAVRMRDTLSRGLQKTFSEQNHVSATVKGASIKDECKKGKKPLRTGRGTGRAPRLPE